MTARFLRGKGIELGPGVGPQALPPGATALYFDKRNRPELETLFGRESPVEVHSMADIPRFFPHGADFLIAHNVLEHIHGEIGALLTWNRWVRDGGVVVLSVPDKRFCEGDRRRLATGFEHVLLDYLLDRDESWLETREHVLSFCLGWASSWDDLAKADFVQHVLSESHRGGHDCHWHALERAVWDRIVAAAATFGGFGLEILMIADPEGTAHPKTEGEIIYVYRLDRGSPRIRGLPGVGAEIEAMKQRLSRALCKLGPVST